jgi:hypothetical protein
LGVMEQQVDGDEDEAGAETGDVSDVEGGECWSEEESDDEEAGFAGGTPVSGKED